jgi:hypothetical protein
MPGLVLLVAVILVAAGVTLLRGFSHWRFVRCSLGVRVGAGLGALPGVVITLLAESGAASGASRAPEWPLILYAPGALSGSFVGLWRPTALARARAPGRGRGRRPWPGS